MTVAIYVEKNDVTIDGLVIADQTLADFLRPLDDEERKARAADALEIGARVLIREQSGSDIDWIRGEFDRVHRETLELVAQLLAADEGQNPLADFKAGALSALRDMAQQLTQALQGMAAQVEGLRVEHESAAALESERERGTAKGRPFEESVAAALDWLAGAQGDSCQHVGDLSSNASRVGDVVVEIGAASGPARGRIVFEAKTGRLSRPQALRELDEALEARDADFAVLVVAGAQKVPANMRSLVEHSGNKLVAYLDEASSVQLETAYALARARVLLRRDAGETIDIKAVSEAVERALVALEEIRRVKQAMTAAQTSIGSAKDLVDGLVTNARAQLQALAELAS